MTLFGIGRRKQRDLWQSHIGLRPVAESQALAKGQCIHHGVLGGNGILPRWPACRPPPHDLPTVQPWSPLPYPANNICTIRPSVPCKMLNRNILGLMIFYGETKHFNDWNLTYSTHCVSSSPPAVELQQIFSATKLAKSQAPVGAKTM